MNDQQRSILEWTVARDEAEALLRSLLDAKRESENRLRELDQVDSLKRLTGNSSIDNAINSTKRMISMLNRAIAGGGEESAGLGAP